MQKLVIASNNKGKIREFKEILGEKFEIIPMSEAGFNADVEENGSTFQENSLIKAKAVATALNLPALADDSGLCVDYLDGAPGLYSARFSGVHGDDAANRTKLLSALDEASDRRAKFCCSICLYYPDGKTLYGYGETLGEILKSEKGSNGFGYDSLFYSYDLKKPFGEATDEEKNSVSHRYRALCDLLDELATDDLK